MTYNSKADDSEEPEVDVKEKIGLWKRTCNKQEPDK